MKVTLISGKAKIASLELDDAPRQHETINLFHYGDDSPTTYHVDRVERNIFMDHNGKGAQFIVVHVRHIARQS